MITMPMSKGAYALGVIVFSVAMSAFTVALLLAFALIAGVDFVLGWSFFVIATPTIFSLAGLTLFIASYAPSAEVGGLMANLLGIVFVMISPVFFPIERAPLFMQWLGVVSPFRYAADGIMKSFSGQSGIWGGAAGGVGFHASDDGAGSMANALAGDIRMGCRASLAAWSLGH